MNLTPKIAPICLILLAGATLGQAATVSVSTGADIQALVNTHPAGTTFTLKSGTYRMQTITPKDGDIFIGESGATLSGSERLTSFSKSTNRGITYWVAEGPSRSGFVNGACDPLFPMCAYPENLYIDGKPLLRVSSLGQVAKGKCYFDYGVSRIYFVDTPTGHTVERSVTPIAFEQGSNDVTIQGLIIEEYATPGQRGTIGDQDPGSRWVLRNNEIRFNHSTGVKVGSDSQVIDNYIHDNGALGLASYTTSGVVAKGNQIAGNNWAGFRITYEAGGVKFGNVRNLTASGNYVHDNRGDGIWCDGGCIDGVFENNTVTNNAKNGISHEISHNWTISNNVVTGNGFGLPNEWMGGAGINLPNSDHVTVSDNLVANNYYGIQLTMAHRKDAPSSDLNNNYIHNNAITMHNGTTGLHQSVNDNAYYTSKGNRFANDTYCIPSSSALVYFWMNNYRTESGWKSYGQDTGGKWTCPAVALTSPSDEASVSGTISISAGAADAESITKVLFYIDDTLVNTSTSSTSSYSWDTTRHANGVHTVKAEAYNHAGQSSTSSVTVTVQN